MFVVFEECTQNRVPFETREIQDLMLELIVEGLFSGKYKHHALAAELLRRFGARGCHHMVQMAKNDLNSLEYRARVLYALRCFGAILCEDCYAELCLLSNDPNEEIAALATYLVVNTRR